MKLVRCRQTHWIQQEVNALLSSLQGARGGTTAKNEAKEVKFPPTDDSSIGFLTERVHTSASLRCPAFDADVSHITSSRNTKWPGLGYA